MSFPDHADLWNSRSRAAPQSIFILLLFGNSIRKMPGPRLAILNEPRRRANPIALGVDSAERSHGTLGCRSEPLSVTARNEPIRRTAHRTHEVPGAERSQRSGLVHKRTAVYARRTETPSDIPQFLLEPGNQGFELVVGLQEQVEGADLILEQTQEIGAAGTKTKGTAASFEGTVRDDVDVKSRRSSRYPLGDLAENALIQVPTAVEASSLGDREEGLGQEVGRPFLLSGGFGRHWVVLVQGRMGNWSRDARPGA
jgi:hypothetical protein